MTNKEFDAILDERLVAMRKTLGSKAKEYAHGDRLSNFNRAGEMLRCSRERALVGMMAKHWVSILDIVDEIDKGNMPPRALVEEKLGDALNYLALLEACIREKISEAAETDQHIKEIKALVSGHVH